MLRRLSPALAVAVLAATFLAVVALLAASAGASGPDWRHDPKMLPQFMAAIREAESGNDYTEVNRSEPPDRAASGAYQIIGSTWRSQLEAVGLGGRYRTANVAPPEVQDRVALRMSTEYFKRYGDWWLCRIAWYGGPGIADMAKAGKKLPPPPMPGANPQSYVDNANRFLPLMEKRLPIAAPAEAPAATPVATTPVAAIRSAGVTGDDLDLGVLVGVAASGTLLAVGVVRTRRGVYRSGVALLAGSATALLLTGMVAGIDVGRSVEDAVDDAYRTLDVASGYSGWALLVVAVALSALILTDRTRARRIVSYVALLAWRLADLAWERRAWAVPVVGYLALVAAGLSVGIAVPAVVAAVAVAAGKLSPGRS